MRSNLGFTKDEFNAMVLKVCCSPKKDTAKERAILELCGLTITDNRSDKGFAITNKDTGRRIVGYYSYSCRYKYKDFELWTGFGWRYSRDNKLICDGYTDKTTNTTTYKAYTPYKIDTMGYLFKPINADDTAPTPSPYKAMRNELHKANSAIESTEETIERELERLEKYRKELELRKEVKAELIKALKDVKTADDCDWLFERVERTVRHRKEM